ncbi:helix-turn-helix domain-containing protein [Lachnospiraceae bacterium YH-ros2226]
MTEKSNRFNQYEVECMEFSIQSVKPISTEELLSYYRKSKGYVKLNSGKNRKGVFCPSNELTDPLSYFNGNLYNLGISLGEYVTPKKGGTKDNLSSINFFAIDIDYSFDLPAETVVEKLMNELIGDGCGSPIPFPTFIEYGHRMRFLYALEHPYILRGLKGKRRERAIRFVQKVAHSYADRINAIDPQYHAEGQKLTSTFRPAGSINRKTCFDKVHNRCVTVCKSVIQIIPGGGKSHDLQFYADYVMTEKKTYVDLQEWKKEHKTKRSSIHVRGIRGGKDYRTERLETLLQLQRQGSCIGMRETMCWNFHNLCLSMGNTREEAYEKLVDFNQNFEVPLSRSEVRSARVRKVYSLKSETFYRQFGMEKVTTRDPEYNRAYGKAYYKEKRSIEKKQGKLFQQKREVMKAKAKKLRSEGYSVMDIARELSVSRRTVYYYLKESERQEYATKQSEKIVSMADVRTKRKPRKEVIPYHMTERQIQEVEKASDQTAFFWFGRVLTKEEIVYDCGGLDIRFLAGLRPRNHSAPPVTQTISVCPMEEREGRSLEKDYDWDPSIAL